MGDELTHWVWIELQTLCWGHAFSLLFSQSTVSQSNQSVLSINNQSPQCWWSNPAHYNDVRMSTMASQSTSTSMVCLIICSGADRRKHQSSVSLAFVRGIHRWLVNSLHKGPVTRKMFPFDDVIMWIWAYEITELKNILESFVPCHLIHVALLKMEFDFIAHGVKEINWIV